MRVDHGVYGHESILKLISYRFGLGDLVKRDREARNIGLSFDWDNPDFEVPDLPDPQHIASAPCTTGGGDVIDETGLARERPGGARDARRPFRLRRR